MASQDFNCLAFVAHAKLMLANKELDHTKSIAEKSFSRPYTEEMITRYKEIVQRANSELDKVCTMKPELQPRTLATIINPAV